MPQEWLKSTSSYKCSSLTFSHALHWITSTHSIVINGTELWSAWHGAPRHHEAAVGFRRRAVPVVVTAEWRTWVILVIVGVKLLQQLRRLGLVAVG